LPLPEDHPFRHAELAPDAGSIQQAPPEDLVFAPVEKFYRDIIDLPIPRFPTRLSRQRKLAATEHWREEIKEFEDAETLADEIDACLDLAWLAIGRAIETGADVPAHWGEIVRANMTRVRGQSPKRPNSQGYDAVKPEGWVGPDHERIIRVKFPKIILLGYARHGKDTVAEILRDRYGFGFQSSSRFLAERVMLPAFAAEKFYYANADDCFADRHGSSRLGEHRAFWYDKISAYNTPDKGRLARELFEEFDIYVGLRAADEFKAAQKLADLVVWVDASGRGLPPESEASCTVTSDMADYILPNNGTLEDLEAAVDHFVSLIEEVKHA
jgi:hypothetical protein